jgi:hypothetical protein
LITSKNIPAKNGLGSANAKIYEGNKLNKKKAKNGGLEDLE